MKVHDLLDGQVVRARFGRYVSTMDHPKWSPWRQVTLYVARDGKGQICTLTPRNKAWAEYDPRRDYCPADPRVPYPAHLLNEDYYMEIEGLE